MRRNGFSRYANMSVPPSQFVSRPRSLQLETSSLDSRVQPRVGGCTSSGQITRTFSPGTAWGLQTAARKKLSTCTLRHHAPQIHLNLWYHNLFAVLICDATGNVKQDVSIRRSVGINFSDGIWYLRWSPFHRNNLKQ